MTVRFYSSTAAETTLTASITSGNTSIQVGSVTGFPVLTPYTLALDYESATEELVEVTGAAGTTLTVTRAIDSTSATAHNAGARVRHVSSARDFADSRAHENASVRSGYQVDVFRLEHCRQPGRMGELDDLTADRLDRNRKRERGFEVGPGAGCVDDPPARH